jgi:hypothetical protein
MKNKRHAGGRPKGSRQISDSDRAMDARVRKLAHRESMSVSAFLRRAVREYLGRVDNDEEGTP